MKLCKSLFILFFLCQLLYSKEFKVGSYNVENLFDLNIDKTEYQEFIPNGKSNWNKKTFQKKLQNISTVIKDMDLDILALQEIESKKALEELLKLLPKYPYHAFLKDKSSAIGVALISKYPIITEKRLDVYKVKKYSRPILEADIKIDEKVLKLFVSHWRSKRAGENYRIEYALTLAKRVKELDKSVDYIILGDLNSNYDEYKTFKKNKKLNTSYEITGINQILNTTVDNKFITKESIKNFENKKVHYNLWLELPSYSRYSYLYRGEKQTPDNIIISAGVLDNKNIDYIDNSFRVFNPDYLFKKNQIFRWQMRDKKFIGEGYSDHLPIYATFTSSKTINKPIIKKIEDYKISTLYDIENINKDIKLKNVIVIYKNGKNMILKQKGDRSIFLYSDNKKFEVGNLYNIKVKNISSYFGQKEIKEISDIENLNIKIDEEEFYIDSRKIDIFDEKYQNEIITNLIGNFKKSYLYFADKRIKLYSKNITDLPKDGDKIKIKRAHLTNYKLKKQLKIYSKSDYEVIN